MNLSPSPETSMVYYIEHFTTTFGLWCPLSESTERTEFRMRPVWHASAEEAEACRREMIAIGWDPARVRVASCVREASR